MRVKYSTARDIKRYIVMVSQKGETVNATAPPSKKRENKTAKNTGGEIET